MKLVKVTCELKYSERVKLLSGYETIYLDMLKKAPEKPGQWLIPGLRIEDKERKRIMLIDPVRGVIDIEEPPNVGFCRDSIMQFFKSIETNIGIPKIARFGIRSTWVEEYKGSFKDLVKKCKHNIYGNSHLIEKADDIGAVFDYDLGTGKIMSVTVGPMEIEQLKLQFLAFKPVSIPSIFLYISVDIGDTTIPQFSSQYLRSFFDDTISQEEKKVTEVVSDLGVD
jgi:hypothetical protein